MKAHLDDDAADRYIDSVARAVPGRPSLHARGAEAWTLLTGTPRRAAAATAWGFALLVAVVCAASQPTVTVTSGPLTRRVACGLDVFVYGYPERSVRSACQTAEAVRFGLFVPALVIVLVGAISALLLVLRSRAATAKEATARWGPPGWLALSAASVAVVADLFALRPAPAQLISGGQLITARCGADSWLSGYPDPTVRRLCGHAYSGQADTLVVATMILIVALAALAWILVRTSAAWDWPRLAAAGAGAVLAVAGAVALVPAAVVVYENGAPLIAECGIDSYVAGYPDHMIQAACRSHYGGHALAALLLFGAAVGCFFLQRYLSHPARDGGAEMHGVPA